MIHKYSRTGRFLGSVVVACLLAFTFSTAAAAIDDPCEAVLEEAEELYLDGAFGATITQLSDCYYRDDLEPALSVEIARLVALAYLNRDDLDAGRRAVLRALSFDPDYEADPIQDPPAYTSMVNIVRRQVSAGLLDVPEVAEERGSRNWLYVIGGAVLTGAVTTAVALISGNGNGDPGGDTLPPPSKLP